MSKDQTHDIIDFNEALSERYLAYALSTIMSRSLPDVRDGLKPVHRRILYAMLKLRLYPDTSFKKSARVVGDVIGKYHPHGDTAVYDTMVRLAQTFSSRYPLIDGQGNFGSIDGDNPAAMRYTEAKLTDLALELMKDLDKDTVDFQDNYDSSEREPCVFPAKIPNLLANGTEGIAVGMATSIPPHNLTELLNGLLAMIEKRDITISELLNIIKGPDFPTGGVIMENPEYLTSIYESGKGSIRLRAKWKKEMLKGSNYQIVVYEIPYQVQKSRLLERLAQLMKEKRVPNLLDINDESDEEMRVILEPKSGSIDPEILMEQLFKLSELEIKYHFNMNVLSKKSTPKILSLKEILEEFLQHRVEVVTRATDFRLNQIAIRLEILQALLIAYLNIDEVIKIIREEEFPKQIMQARWSLSDIQVEAILNIKLRALQKLEEVKIKTEETELLAEQKELNERLSSKMHTIKYVAKELKEIKKIYSKNDERRTIFKSPNNININITEKDFIIKEEITLIITQNGWIRSFKGHNYDVSKVKYKTGDQAHITISCCTTDQVILFSNNGKVFTLAPYKLSDAKNFEPLSIFCDNNAKAKWIYAYIYQPAQQILLVSDHAKGFITPSENLVSSTKNGKSIMGLAEKSLLCYAQPIASDHDTIAIISNNRRLLIFNLNMIPIMQKGKGVMLQKYKSINARVSDVQLFNFELGLSYKKGRKLLYLTQMAYWLGGRGSRGHTPPIGFPKNNKFES